MRILFVATLFSPHTGRWISQLEGTGWDIHVTGGGTPHPNLRTLKSVTLHPYPQKRWRFSRGGDRLKQIPVLRRVLFPAPENYLAHVIDRLQPDCIHSLKMQSESYQVFAARKVLGGRFLSKWIYSSWGSDIYLHQKDPVHLAQIKKVLTAIDYFVPDCERDIALARKYGFRGEVLGIFPVAGAYPIGQMLQGHQPGNASTRGIVALKGYQTKNVGRALVALDAIRRTADSLKNFKIVIHSAVGSWASEQYPQVKAAADDISAATGLCIEFMPFSPVEDIWQLFGRSRISIGISASDGTPNTMLESMVMGAFPIQSDTGAISEWIEDGVNGSIVPYDDPDLIAQAIIRASIDDKLVDQAARINAKLVSERLEPSVIIPKIHAMYKRVMEKNSNN